MPLKIQDKDFDAILKVIARFPSGISMRKLIESPELHFKKRTLQRRLDELIGQKRLVPLGEGRGRRYAFAETLPKDQLPAMSKKHDWLTCEAEEIRSAVVRSPSLRMPVGYQAAFLEDYRPNDTVYVPPEIRRKLAEMGQVGLTDLPAGTYLRQVLDRLLIDLSWNSSRLEGNTYSLLETERLIEFGESAEGKGASETQMILNHKAAIEMLADQSEWIGFNRYTICNIHALLSDNLLADPAAGGRLRMRPVGIAGTVFHPLEVPQQIEEQFDHILQKADAITDPFEQSFFVMVHLPYLQPFEDVNKRVSRLAANIPLIKGNLCPLSFIDVAQEDYVNGLIGIYELNRIEYLRDVFVWAYQRSCARYAAARQSLGDPDPFRLRYRTQIGRVVREVVQGGMDKGMATKWITNEAEEHIPGTDKSKFANVIERELGSLHAGNIARYRLRPSEFEAWKSAWK